MKNKSTNIFTNYSLDELFLFVQHDDGSAFEELFERTWKILLNETYRFTRDLPFSESLIEGAYGELWEHRALIQTEDILTYLRRITYLRFLL